MPRASRRRRHWPRGEERLELHAYQRDAIRLLIRNFHRPEEIPAEIWEGLMWGELEQVQGKYLEVISRMAPHLRRALSFWDDAGRWN